MERKTLLQEVIDTLVEREGMSRSVADTFGHAFFEVIEEALRNDKFVKVKGFGTFKLVPVSERESVNVNTGERIQIGSHSKVTFTPDAYLRDLVNKPFSHFQTTVLNDDTSLDELEAADELIPAEPEAPEAEAAEEAPETLEQAPTEQAPAEETPAEETPAPEDPAPRVEKVDSIDSADSIETVETIEKAEAPAPAAPTYKIEDETIPDAPPAYHIDESPEQEQEQPEEQQAEAQPETTAEEAPAPRVETIEKVDSVEKVETIEKLEADAPEEEASEEEVLEEEAPSYPTRRRIKWWKLLVALLFILLLMGVSYFAGYFRVFCPPCEAAQEQQAAPQQPATTPAASTQPAQPTVPDSTKSAASTAEGKPAAQPAVDNAKQPTEADKTKSAQESKPTQESKPEKKTYNPAIHYEISGTRETYTVKAGEGVYRIAAKLYGNKKFAPYIIKHNKLRDPDNIAVGAKLKIPELVEPTN